MKFNNLIAALHDQAWFDLPTLRLLFPSETIQTLRTSLHRFMKEGNLIGIRRGLYCFGDSYGKKTLHGPLIANLCYSPSYLSERWALSWYGIILEQTVLYTSVTTRPTRIFRNRWGEFRYRTIRRSQLSGFIREDIQGFSVLIAEPEQALLDLWYLEGEEWTVDRMASWRFDVEPIRDDRLAALNQENPCARPGDRARLERVIQAWIKYRTSLEKGGRSK